MKKTLMTTVAAAAIGALALVTATPANAFVWWIVPAIAGGVLGGAVIGSAVNNQPVYGPPPTGTVYVRPTPACHIEREHLAGGGWRRVRVCD